MQPPDSVFSPCSQVFSLQTGTPVAAVPALALAQRPDRTVIERSFTLASAKIGVAEADRYPKTMLTDYLGYSVGRALGTTSDGSIW